MPPSRQFKENFIVGGCFTLSLIAFLLVLAAFHPWFFLPAFLIGWAFVLWQSIRMGIWKTRSGQREATEEETKKSPRK